jgi:hypothetical protein
VRDHFKNYISNRYFKTLSEPTAAITKTERKHFEAVQRPRSGKLEFLAENDDAVKALAPYMAVKNNNRGGKHKKAGSELWNSLGEDEQARWQRAAALKAR